MLVPSDGVWGGGLAVLVTADRILVPRPPLDGDEGAWTLTGWVDRDTQRPLVSRAWRLV